MPIGYKNKTYSNNLNNQGSDSSSDYSSDSDDEISRLNDYLSNLKMQEYAQYVTIDAEDGREAPTSFDTDAIASSSSSEINSESRNFSENNLTTISEVAKPFNYNKPRIHSFSNLNAPSTISKISPFSYRNTKDSDSSLEEMNNISTSQSTTEFEISETSTPPDSNVKENSSISDISLKRIGSISEINDASQDTNVSNKAVINYKKRSYNDNSDSDSELTSNDSDQGFRKKISTGIDKNIVPEVTPTGFNELISSERTSTNNTPTNIIETIITNGKRPRTDHTTSLLSNGSGSTDYDSPNKRVRGGVDGYSSLVESMKKNQTLNLFKSL